MANSSVATSCWLKPFSVAWIGAKPAIIIDRPPTASMPAMPTGEIRQAAAKAIEAPTGTGGCGSRVMPIGSIDSAVKTMPTSGACGVARSTKLSRNEPTPSPTT